MTTLDSNHKLYATYGITSQWHTKMLGDFTNDGDAKQHIEQYLETCNSNPRFGFTIFGDPGVGKSYLLNALAMRLTDRGFVVKVTSLTKLMNSITNTFKGDTSYKSLCEVVKKPDFLFIDDVGKEFKSEQLASKALMFALQLRIEVSKPAFIATKFRPKEFKQEYGEDVASLLKEISIPLHVKGKDYRDKIFDQNKELLG